MSIHTNSRSAVHAATSRMRSSHGIPLLTLCVIACLLSSGCGRGIRWEFGRFQDVHKKSRQQNQLTFVYFRDVYSLDSTRFEEKVLKTPEVLAETDQYICVPLDYYWDRPLAEKWGIRSAPSFALVDPNGAILSRKEGITPKEEVVETLKKTREEFASRRRSSVGVAPSP